MDYDENTLNSAPTMGPGGDASTTRPPFSDEPSLGSAPTMAPDWDASTTRPPSSLGQIDQYQLVRKLGGGGFGVVYLARDTVSGVEVALKTLHPLLKSNPEEMDALRAKFALVSRLSHPNIASPLVLHPCRDIVITDDEARRELRLSPGDSIMVMRYAPGVTLSKWRKQFPDGVVPLDSALEIARQIASALDYAHGERIVHRDVKPANVMVETLPEEASQPSTKEEVRSTKDEGCAEQPTNQLTTSQLTTGGCASRIRVRILDFGLAAEIRSSMSRVSTETGDTSGTRPYMAPEQWPGKKQDGRTDQYALACVLYELLSGAPPFAGVFETGDPTIMMAAVKNEAPEEIDNLPAHVNTALQKALAKNPKGRFASCTEFVESCFEPQRTQSSQSQEDGRADIRVGREVMGGPRFVAAETTHGGRDGALPSQASAASEADVLRRKLALTRAVKAISAEDRADKEFTEFVGKAEDELAVAEEACKFGRFAAAAESLNVAEKALDNLRKAKLSREESERKAREEAERKAREEAERRAREAAERKAREEVERKAREEAESKARDEAIRKVREEAERRARFYVWLGRRIMCVMALVACVTIYQLLPRVKFSGDGTKLLSCPKGKSGAYVIPNSVKSIGWGAFSGCSGLKSVTIPDSVQSIEPYAFSDCSGLTSVIIPSSVKSIGNSAFCGCSGLTSVIIPDSVQSIEPYAFSDCSGLTSVIIPSSVKSIGNSAFSGCSGLTSVTIPNSVKSIGNSAFSGCSGLTSVTIPTSVTDMGHNAFFGCRGLTSVTIPGSISSIGGSTFQECDHLKSVTIGSGVRYIKQKAFAFCGSLMSITIPDTVKSIGDDAFRGCDKLDSATKAMLKEKWPKSWRNADSGTIQSRPSIFPFPPALTAPSSNLLE